LARSERNRVPFPAAKMTMEVSLAGMQPDCHSPGAATQSKQRPCVRTRQWL
jgi:hypothetical protein